LAHSWESCASRTAADCDQAVDLPGVAAVPGPQRLDLGDSPLVLGDDPLTPLVRDVEQRALQLARNPFQALRPVLHAGRVVRSGR
jgi:hypothetical protein